MRIIARPLVVIFIVLVISGCVSVEELARQELGSITEDKNIFVECKAKRRAVYNWLKRKNDPMTSHEVGPRSRKAYTDCLEEKLPGLIFQDVTSTTSLDIYSKQSLRFFTGGDHLIENYFENSRKWDRALHEGKEPWDGYWLQYNEALVKWESKFKGSN